MSHAATPPGPDHDGTQRDTGTLMLWEGSPPLDAPALTGTSTSTEPTERAIVLHLPLAILPVPEPTLRHLAAQPIPPTTGPGLLLARFMEGLADQCATLETKLALRLGSAAVDLSAVFLMNLADARGLLLPQPRKAELLGEIKSFVMQNLGEPRLSPALIASAHHISVRYLHCLFQADKHTVSGFLREQRLERCRAELADPAHAARSVGAIRARWGFPDAAVFGRAFKRTYGVSPGEYRKRRLEAPCPSCRSAEHR
ncbi:MULTISPECIES: helix-turn-helix domain-containing protein [Streptomyces]|uniref:helix-turn-helix domain-containing protein n=1 Tax=Streptomyces TaxID=1883 RepID=UPI00342BF01A